MRTNQKKDPFKYLDEYVEMEKKIFKDKHTLRMSYIPEQLPEREKEIEKLKWYLKDALIGNTPSNVFIYGHPGTGKTVCCKKVLRDLHEEITERKISNLRIMYINCAATHTESQVIADIANFFTKKQLAPIKGWPTSEYYRIFGNTLDKIGGIFIIALDEVDKLVPENENVLYNLSRASDHILSNAELSLIGVSNTLTFYKELDPRIKSSLCQRKIILNPYTAPQLEKILSQRAKEAFTKDALGQGVIPHCAALAAQEHGDARKAVDLLRLAGEFAEAEAEEHVREKDVRMAQEELKKSEMKEAIVGLPTHRKIALLSIAQLTRGKCATITGEAYERYKTLIRLRALPAMTLRRFRDIIDHLRIMGICNTYVLARGRHGRTTKIELVIPFSDVKSALFEDEFIAPLM